ncbi:threonine dehydratase [Actinopolymorpha cephalotaxi]|uniref:threonine ammonia-lyase n=1 Tax=Actinopolymorpha cephalotaxi TaxID=504797 RepID=A0A1I2MBN0_9ACTN|nr:threonine ammonia-lyase [Actinopolymorpha cephalotaxi]NYH81655.1 threonine dehydratase [Actinopolymorpha cephalotaxi]SFF88308.1 threonine dehydratase [Actinopolymorpha cephalotaxi]
MTGARPHDSPYDSATGSPDGSAEDSPDLGALLADIEDAERTLRGIARTTPMEASRWLADRVGGPVHLKCENLQRAGSFKIRGAYVRISRLSQAERARGVVAASAGNHAQGVALAARLLDTRATVFMPFGAPIPKEEATRSYGADVRFHGHTIDEALVAARQYSEETGAVFIHPFDHADIMAGQGTLGLEILEQCPDVATVLVSTGGGGLVAGVAAALAGRGSKARVVGVQAAGAAAYPPSLAAGRPVPVERMRTMADGIAVGCPGGVPFEVVRRWVAGVVTVSEESLSRSLLLLLERGKLLVEPAGAAAVAAALDAPGAFEPPVVAVLSGGNIDPLLLMRVLRHGMIAAGRYLSLRVRVPDQPGGLAALLRQLAEADANVLDVVHQRTGAGLHLGDVDVALQLETRGKHHREEILHRLRSAGYTVNFS